MKKLITTVTNLLMVIVFTSFSVTDRTSCTIKDSENTIEVTLEFPKAKTQKVFEKVNELTDNVFELNTSNPNVKEKKHITNNYVLFLESSAKKIYIKALKNENNKNLKSKLTQLVEAIKPIINN